MLARYAWRDLTRNPRRTVAAAIGITLGVGLFSGVLFFIDGSGASMTRRAIAPLALDLQRVLTSPLGARLELTERLTPIRAPGAGNGVRVALTVTNHGTVPAHEVVVGDELAPGLAYVGGTTTRDGRLLRDPGAGTPLAQGLARSGLNLGAVPPGRTVRLVYVAKSAHPVPAAALRPRAQISSQQSIVPTRANVPSQLTLGELAARVRRIPGVAHADGLAFVDLPPGSLSVGGVTTPDTVRVFGFDRAYAAHYPAIRTVAGSFAAGRGALSAEAARTLRARPGSVATLRLPGARGPVPVPIGGVADLSAARSLFNSRRSTDLESFLYVPSSIVLDLETFRRRVVPAFQMASAAHGTATKSLPLEELDVLVQRSRLRSDPGAALAQTRAIARAVRAIAPEQDYQIDNISNTLQVARDDAAVAKRMFLFLGIPGALLAAFLAAFAGGILALAQRREQANLRIRGADRSHLLRMLAYRTLALAGAGSVVGTALGLLSVIAILGSTNVFEASTAELALSALIGVGVGMFTTALALYVPGRRSLQGEIGQERGELVSRPEPAWRRLRLDFVLLAVLVAGEAVALGTGVFDAPPGSVYEGRAVSLPTALLLAPVVAWIAGVMLSLRVFDALASRLPLPAATGFGTPVWGILVRSLRRRSWTLAGGTSAVALVVAFGMSLAIFTATYDAAKGADARFLVGSDMRVTPSVLSTRPHPSSFASRLRTGPVRVVAPVVFKPQNAVLTSSFNEDQVSLAAIEPAGFARVAPLSGASFPGGNGKRRLAALRRDPRGALINARTADELKIGKGDRVQVLFARGTRRQALVALRVVGIFTRLPGFPQGVQVVANLAYYASATHSDRPDFFLARTAAHGPADLARATAALRAGPGRGDRLTIDTTRTALDKDQSSLTALNVKGLLRLDALYTLLMAAAAIGIFVFGLILQRRREYVTMRAQGMRTGELRRLVLGETAAVTVFGLAAGMLVGSVMGYLLVRVLRPLFVLDPGVSLSLLGTLTLVALVAVATVASALAATALLRRLRPTELLREA